MRKVYVVLFLVAVLSVVMGFAARSAARSAKGHPAQPAVEQSVKVVHVVPPVPKNPKVCAFVAQLEANQIAVGHILQADERNVITVLLDLNGGLPEELKEDAFAWLREAVYIAYHTDGSDDEKVVLLLGECTGNAI